MAAPVSLDAAMLGSEDYFERSRIRPLLADALAQLAREQPKDAVAALRRILATGGVRQQGSAECEEVEAIDFDTLPEDDLELEPLGLVTLERLPGAKAGRGQDLSENRCWAGAFSRPLLEGWLPQPSPCCAAASVAGAFNALHDFGRNHSKSASIVEVAELMAKNCDRLFAQRQQRVERMLGLDAGDFDTVLAALDTELLARGLDWTSSGPEAVTRAVALSTLRELLAARKVGEETTADRSEAAFVALRRALGMETTVPSRPESAQSNDRAGVKIVVAASEPDWDQELGELIGKRRGSMRLRHPERPHTGEIGSWGIKQAVTDLSNERGCNPMHAHVILGRKGGPKVDVPVSNDDSAEAIEHQWATFKGAFSKPNSVLLFHLTNHYALVYAWREWLEDAACDKGLPRTRRQILTARKGQRPTVWLDFDEARSIMVGWSGYHVLQLQRTVSAPAVAGAEVGSPGGA